eukprot:1287041-Rhodomonas_salina.3
MAEFNTGGGEHNMLNSNMQQRLLLPVAGLSYPPPKRFFRKRGTSLASQELQEISEEAHRLRLVRNKIIGLQLAGRSHCDKESVFGIVNDS